MCIRDRLHPLSPTGVIKSSSQILCNGGSVAALDGTTLVCDTDIDDKEPWLGLKKAEGVRPMLDVGTTLEFKKL